MFKIKQKKTKKPNKLSQQQATYICNIGIALQEKHNLGEAISCYRKALELNPGDGIIIYNLGSALHKIGQIEEAIHYYQRAIQLNPDNAVAFNNLGSALQEKGQIDEAISHYQKALKINPNYANAHYNLGVAFRGLDKQEEALTAFDKAIGCNPRLLSARFARCMSQFPTIYLNTESIQTSRSRYYSDLLSLRDIIALKNSEDIAIAADIVGDKTPFYLAYQGYNDRELQQLYGDLICEIMALRYPQYIERPTIPPPLSGEPLRVGVVSNHFRQHAVWNIPIRGWITNIDKRRFSLYGYYTGQKSDQETQIARQCFTRFVESTQSVETLCKTIKDDNLHVLIFPEIGMDKMTIKLATLRLAPVQCTSWGHPQTSGLRNIDYFISSNLMEPPDADEHYTERLIRLPNLSIYHSTQDAPTVDLNREKFNLRPNSIVYNCLQLPHKYLPQYDEVFPRIAEQVGDCQFVFASYPAHVQVSVNEKFRNRICEAFTRFNLTPRNHVVFLPFLSQEDYYAINRLSDIYLDSISWSGCNSAFEAVACNLPIVTLTGKLMRNRMAFAILSIMGLDETIASSVDDFVGLAVRLGKDPQWRSQVSNKIAQNKHLLYQDRNCITALEDFLEAAVNQKAQ